MTTQPKVIEEIMREFRKNHSEPCDGIHKGSCSGEKIDEHTYIILGDIRQALTQAFETGRDMGRGEAIEIVTNADAPYTTECCRKTANFYKDQIKEGLTNLAKPSE